MALTLNTPGVFVEEISTLPPSVAQVATAIPAFIGYTEKAERPDGSTLNKVPVRITSMLEYEIYFGTADKQKQIKVKVQGGAISTDLDPQYRSIFMMYHSLQMYFANGGGPCYIVSVGKYNGTSSISRTTLELGLTELEKEDEPTLILFPDATSLTPASEFYALYNAALMQCNKLQDRFTIIDTQMTKVSNVTGLDVTADIDALRLYMTSDGDYTKYGAAYYPYLNTILDYTYIDEDVQVTIDSGIDYEAQVNSIVTSLSSNQLAIQNYVENDLDTIHSMFTSIPSGEDPDEYARDVIKPLILAKVAEIINMSATIGQKVTNGVNIGRSVLANATPGTPDYNALLAGTNVTDVWVTDIVDQTVFKLNQNIDAFTVLSPTATLAQVKALMDGATNSVYDTLGVGDPVNYVGNINEVTSSGNFLSEMAVLLNPYSNPVAVPVDLSTLVNSDNALYNRIKTAISQMPLLLPPSSSIAGVYARVDANDGVWKAPANVSVNYILGPNVMITNDQQGGMNIDNVGGKSINAIRTFTGRGTLVWGARTLNGNSNEWKYVSVRRFFNFVEESVQQATEAFVFEANDANTWVQLRAMIENFLILQWKAGALAGAKPEQAFYVRVGLGQTMTADDILNGRMIVEIGMAVVRPAEFIVLRFSHMMQQS